MSGIGQLEKKKKKIGFVFDLDGVIYHSGSAGKALVPRTADALHLLEAHNIPYAFVSNGTGYSEQEKAALIEGLLADAATGPVSVPREKVFLCATPMRELAVKYADKRVMIVCGDIRSQRGTAERLATDLGFKNFVTMADFAARRPGLMPTKQYEQSEELLAGKSLEPIAACFVLSEPGDWHESLQVLADVIACGGDIAQLEPDADWAAAAAKAAKSLADSEAEGAEAEDRVSFNVYLTNPDIVYPVRNAPPRFTLGSFGLCLGTMYQRLTTLRPGLCGPLNLHYCGKPFPMVFKSAQKYLAEKLQLNENEQLDAIYMVGGESPGMQIASSDCSVAGLFGILTVVFVLCSATDNPPSDICGANNMGSPWQSCLVRTGNFHGVTNDDTYPAQHVLQDAYTVVTTMLVRFRCVFGCQWCQWCQYRAYFHSSWRSYAFRPRMVSLSRFLQPRVPQQGLTRSTLPRTSCLP